MLNQRWFRSANIIVFLIVIAAAGYFAWSRSLLPFLPSTSGQASRQIDTNAWQAVFTNSGQVYFGHLSGWESGNPVLTKVYYLQTQNVQPVGKDKTQPDPEIKVIKLGGEIHGPEDAVFFNKSQISYVENLKPSSKVMDIIKQYESTQR